jgi:hypothetical protein
MPLFLTGYLTAFLTVQGRLTAGGGNGQRQKSLAPV